MILTTQVPEWQSKLRERVYAEMQPALGSWQKLGIKLKIKLIPKDQWNETTEKIRNWIGQNCSELTKESAAKINSGDLSHMIQTAFDGIVRIGVEKVRSYISSRMKVLPESSVEFGEKDFVDAESDCAEIDITFSDLDEEKDCVEIKKPQKSEYKQLIEKDELLKRWEQNPSIFWKRKKSKP